VGKLNLSDVTFPKDDVYQRSLKSAGFDRVIQKLKKEKFFVTLYTQTTIIVPVFLRETSSYLPKVAGLILLVS